MANEHTPNTIFFRKPQFAPSTFTAARLQSISRNDVRVPNHLRQGKSSHIPPPSESKVLENKRTLHPLSHRKGHHMGILESSTAGPVGQLLGMTVWGQQFLGWRFNLATPSRITHIGGHLCREFAGTGLFSAIIKLASPTSFPAFAPRLITTSPDTLAHLLFTPSSPSTQLLVPLSVPLVLHPGTYGLVFGGGDMAIAQNPYAPFGATGTGVMPMNNLNLHGSTYFFGDQFRWSPVVPSDANLRFSVAFEAVETGDTTPPAPPSGLRIS